MRSSWQITRSVRTVIVQVVNQNLNRNKMKKDTTKKPELIVNLTAVDTCDDIQLEFIKAKSMQGFAITEDEFKFIVKYGAELAFDTIDACLDAFLASGNYTKIEDDQLAQDIVKLIEEKINPKKPWYKRFWGWVTKPFKKNK